MGILLRSAHARKRLSPPLSLLQNVSSHRTRRRRIEETTRKDRFERERKVAWWWWSSRACPLRGTKVFGRDKICVCFGSNEEKETKKKGQHHDHDGRVHANAHAVAGESEPTEVVQGFSVNGSGAAAASKGEREKNRHVGEQMRALRISATTNGNNASSRIRSPIEKRGKMEDDDCGEMVLPMTPRTGLNTN